MIARTIAAALLVAMACALLAPFVSAARMHRLDVNGEPLSYNARCSTDTDCAERFGQ